MNKKATLLVLGLALIVIGIGSFSGSKVLGVVLLLAAVVSLIASLAVGRGPSDTSRP